MCVSHSETNLFSFAHTICDRLSHENLIHGRLYISLLRLIRILCIVIISMKYQPLKSAASSEHICIHAHFFLPLLVYRYKPLKAKRTETELTVLAIQWAENLMHLLTYLSGWGCYFWEGLPLFLYWKQMTGTATGTRPAPSLWVISTEGAFLG